MIYWLLQPYRWKYTKCRAVRCSECVCVGGGRLTVVRIDRLQVGMVQKVISNLAVVPEYIDSGNWVPSRRWCKWCQNLPLCLFLYSFQLAVLHLVDVWDLSRRSIEFREDEDGTEVLYVLWGALRDFICFILVCKKWPQWWCWHTLPNSVCYLK